MSFPDLGATAELPKHLAVAALGRATERLNGCLQEELAALGSG